jgi:hypothetical protein
LPLRDGWPTDAFEQWYGLYARKAKPHEARRAFAKVQASGEITFSVLMARTKAAVADWATWPKDRQQFIPYPASWLNGGAYLTALQIPSKQRPSIAEPERDPVSFTDAEWVQRCKYFAENRLWPSQWGPPPGELGCLVPLNVLVLASGEGTHV